METLFSDLTDVEIILKQTLDLAHLNLFLKPLMTFDVPNFDIFDLPEMSGNSEDLRLGSQRPDTGNGELG